MQTPQPPTFNANYQWGQNSQNRNQTFRGFYVNDPAEIRPGDVPMDGSICFFPASNLSSITIKQWNSMGQLDTMVFVPAPNQVPQTPPQIQQTQNQTPQIQQIQAQPAQQPQDQTTNDINQSFNQLCGVIQNGFVQLGERFTQMESLLTEPIQQRNQNQQSNSSNNGRNQNNKEGGGQR